MLYDSNYANFQSRKVLVIDTYSSWIIIYIIIIILLIVWYNCIFSNLVYYKYFTHVLYKQVPIYLAVYLIGLNTLYTAYKYIYYIIHYS